MAPRVTKEEMVRWVVGGIVCSILRANRYKTVGCLYDNIFTDPDDADNVDYYRCQTATDPAKTLHYLGNTKKEIKSISFYYLQNCQLIAIFALVTAGLSLCRKYDQKVTARSVSGAIYLRL